MEKDKNKKNHQVMIKERNSIEITGVINLDSFDSHEFVMQTECGYLGIRGEELTIKNLDLENGTLSIEGFIMDVNYLDNTIAKKEKSKGLFSRIFK